MGSDRPIGITDADIRSLAAKLKGLHALLTPAEQAVLHTLLRRAATREESGEGADTEGFIWGVGFNPFTYLDQIEFNPPVERDRLHGRHQSGRNTNDDDQTTG